jgi:hypothetical protein
MRRESRDLFYTFRSFARPSSKKTVILYSCYSFPQSTVEVREDPFPPQAGCGREGVFISNAK